MPKRKFFAWLVSLIAIGFISFWMLATYLDRDSLPDPPITKRVHRNADIADLTTAQPANRSISPAAIPGASNNQSQLLTDADQSLVDQTLLHEYLSKRSFEKYKIVTVNSDVLRSEIRNVEQDGVLEINLFDGETVRLVSDEAQEHHTGWQTGFAWWGGKIENEEFSIAIFSVSPDGTVNGTIRSDSGRIRLEAIGESRYHLLWKQDPDVSIKID